MKKAALLLGITIICALIAAAVVYRDTLQRIKLHHWMDSLNQVGQDDHSDWLPDQGFKEATERLPLGTAKVDGIRYPTLKQAFSAAKNGSVITLGPGRYRDAGILSKDNVAIYASKGAVIHSTQVSGKGALLITGDNTYIEGLECHSIFVADNNGACVRLEGKNLTLNRVYFHDAQAALVGSNAGGRIVIENSRIENMATGHFYHGIYVLYGTDRLEIRNSIIINTQYGGHEVKSRARHTEITDSIIGSPNSRDSRLVDAPNGGTLLLHRNTFIEGSRSENADLFSWGVEGVKYEGMVSIIDNLILSDQHMANLISTKGSPARIQIHSNRVVGSVHGINSSDNSVFSNRSDAAIPASPFIPGEERIEHLRLHPKL